MSAKKKKPLPIAAMVVLSIAGVLVLKQTFLLLILGMLPSIVTFITDRVSGKPLFKTMLAFNFAGVFYFLMNLMASTPIDTNAVKATLRDAGTWFSIYSTAAIAYLVYYSAPYIAFASLRLFTEGNLIRLRSSKQRLLNDWGPDIKIGADE